LLLPRNRDLTLNDMRALHGFGLPNAIAACYRFKLVASGYIEEQRRNLTPTMKPGCAATLKDPVTLSTLVGTSFWHEVSSQ
jgi:hypothetical protein